MNMAKYCYKCEKRLEYPEDESEDAKLEYDLTKPWAIDELSVNARKIIDELCEINGRALDPDYKYVYIDWLGGERILAVPVCPFCREGSFIELDYFHCCKHLVQGYDSPNDEDSYVDEGFLEYLQQVFLLKYEKVQESEKDEVLQNLINKIKKGEIGHPGTLSCYLEGIDIDYIGDPYGASGFEYTYASDELLKNIRNFTLKRNKLK